MRLHRLRSPQCPECQSKVSLLRGLALWNPWRVKCPKCAAPLQMSKVAKVAVVLAIPIGILYGAIPIYMEETGRWVQADSYAYFALSIPLLLGLGYFGWYLTRLERRS